MDAQYSFGIYQAQTRMAKQSSKVNYSVDLTLNFLTMLSTGNQTFFFFPRESTVTSFSFCVFIVALFFLLWNKTRSHLFGSPPNQTSTEMRPQLWLFCELTISSLFNSPVMSLGKKKNVFQIFFSGGNNFLFCSNPSQSHSKCLPQAWPKLPMSLIWWHRRIFLEKNYSLIGIMGKSLPWFFSMYQIRIVLYSQNHLVLIESTFILGVFCLVIHYHIHYTLLFILKELCEPQRGLISSSTVRGTPAVTGCTHCSGASAKHNRVK